MAYEFHLPDIGEGLTEATIVKWLVEVGQSVGLDEPVVEMETDKAVVEIPAPRAGIVLHLGAEAGTTIPVESLLVVIGDDGEDWEPGDVTDASLPTSSEAAPIVGNLEEATEVVAAPTESARVATGANVQALPLVRRLAGSLGVDLASVVGSGPGGRITRQDVESAAQSDDSGERTRMSPTRLAIARNMVRSWNEIPHVTTYGSADAEALLLGRKAASDELGASVPIEAMLMKRLVPLLGAHREFNAFVEGDDIVYRATIDVGFAVDTPNGLMVAVVRDVANQSLDAITKEVRRLAAAARDRTITAAEMRGAGFTLSNIGAVGGRYGTPIIPFGTSAILSVGRADPQPVVRDGSLEIGREFPLSLSYDHRIIDGAAGRGFMADLIAAIEEGE